MQPTQHKNFTPDDALLAVALELSKGSWKIALHDGKRDKPAIHTVSDEEAPTRLAHAATVIEEMKRKWQLDQHIHVAVVYEAGQDAFWIGRALVDLGYEALAIDPASIPVERHARRAKTDRLDAIKLVTCLRAWLRGERDRMHVIQAPSPQAEAQRHLVRDRGEMQKECGQHRDRMRKLLRTVGCWDPVEGDFAQRLTRGEVLCHDGTAIAPELQERLSRECERLALVEQQLAALEKRLVKQLPPPVQERIVNLTRLKGVGEVGAMRLILAVLARFRQPAPARLVRRPGAAALRQRRKPGRSRHQQARQPAGARVVDRDGVDVAALPARQRAGELVRATHARQRTEQARQAHCDRGGGAQAGDRLVAVCEGWRDTERRGAEDGIGAAATQDERQVKQDELK